VQLGDLPGVPKPAEEHRYYGVLNYTALFGQLTADKIPDKGVDLDIISVDALKDAATRITFDLPAPSRNQQRPQPLRLEGEDR
jgi:hypothetical protein